MSRLEKLSIKGIRSFNPKEKSTLVFHTPLTIIVGANGTGKTTIIESLKYVTTGDLPPNSRGGAFVNDPKIAKEIDVRAEVSLLFRNNRNELLHCLRVIQSSSRKSHDRALEQKTLECSLAKEVAGREVLVTSKQADVDRTVPMHLGVSHSILDNVIFCHQDESTWPIGDPTVMKRKLDEIFSSTKYNKALLALKATKKEITTDMKLKTQELAQLLKEKQRRDEIVKKIEDREKEIERKSGKYREYEEEARRLEATAMMMEEELQACLSLEEAQRILRSEFEECGRFISNFASEIVEDPDKEGAERRLIEAEERASLLGLSRIEEEFAVIERFRQLVLEERDNNRKRENKIGIYEHELKELLKERQDGHVEDKAKYEEVNEEEMLKMEKEFEMEKERFLTAKSDERRVEMEMKQKKEFINQYSELKARSMEIGDVEIDYEKKTVLEGEIDVLTETIERKEAEIGSQGNEEARRRMYEEEINKIEEWLGGQSIEEMKERLKKKIEEGKEKERRKIAEDEDRRVNIGVISEIRCLLESLCDENTSNDDFSVNVNNNVNTVRLLKHIRTADFLKQEPEKELQSLNSELAICCGKIENGKYANAIYMNFLELGSKNNDCPLCKSHMSEEIAVSFKNRLESFLTRLNENTTAAQGKLTGLKASIELYNRENIEICRRNQIRSSVTQLIEKLRISTEDGTSSREWQPNLVWNMRMVVSHLSSSHFNTESENTNDNLIANHIKELVELERKSDELTRLGVELNALTKNTKTSETRNLLRTMKDQLKEKRLELTAYTTEIKRKENERRIMNEEKENRINIERRDKFIKEVDRIKLQDLSEWEDKVKEKERNVRNRREKYERQRAEAGVKKKRLDEIERKIKEVADEMEREKINIKRRYKDETIIFDGERIQVEMEDEEYERIRARVLGHKNGIIKAVREVERARQELKIAEDNLKLRKKKERMIEIEMELKRMNVGRTGELRERKRKIEERRERVNSGANVLRGELKQLMQSVKTDKNELEKWKGSGREYVRCQVEIRAIELSSEDIDKCIGALDKAIVEFHRGRIEEVNRTLRELWTSTYKGSDIDYIELKAESNETRAYNYRMVMVKNGVELEMRGRSSAGQKMIGSILFRIALADAFSNGCNVLALDEPTTNLDKENMESLGQTLSFIIKERRDFQLIVITHDEEFVSLLNREGCEDYYRLKRDGEGRGYIEGCSVYYRK